MVAPATWALFLGVVIQAYTAYLLFIGVPSRWSRNVLALLFLANAFVTLDAFTTLVAGRGLPGTGWADAATLGLLVLVAAIATRRTGPAMFAAVAVAAVLAGGAIATGEGLLRLGPTFTLGSYAISGLMLASGIRKAGPGPDATWLLAALAPRFLELAAEYGRGVPFASPAGLLTVLAVALIALSVVGGAWAAATSVRPRLPVTVLFLALGTGLVLAAAQLVLPTPRDLLFTHLSLALRAMVFLLALTTTGLLGARIGPGNVVRHAAIMTGTGLGFLVVLGLVREAIPESGPGPTLFLATAIILTLLPVLALTIDRLARDDLPDPAREALPAGGTPPPPHLRPALAALTRPERVLLALRGSSQATLGQPRYTQQGLARVTDIPAKHLSAAVHRLNERAPGGPLVRTSTGTRGIRHYWLTAAGAAESEGAAARLGLSDPQTPPSWVGERWRVARTPLEPSAD